MLDTAPAAKPRTKGLSMPALGRKNKPTRQAPGLEVEQNPLCEKPSKNSYQQLTANNPHCTDARGGRWRGH